MIEIISAANNNHKKIFATKSLLIFQPQARGVTLYLNKKVAIFEIDYDCNHKA